VGQTQAALSLRLFAVLKDVKYGQIQIKKKKAEILCRKYVGF
jgi:hypothetical protein